MRFQIKAPLWISEMLSAEFVGASAELDELPAARGGPGFGQVCVRVSRREGHLHGELHHNSVNHLKFKTRSLVWLHIRPLNFVQGDRVEILVISAEGTKREFLDLKRD